MSEQPVIAQKAPYASELAAGTYWWCACGKSQKQPFCDGSHKGGPFVPQQFAVDQGKTVWLCGCKQSANKPYCDGTHRTL